MRKWCIRTSEGVNIDEEGDWCRFTDGGWFIIGKGERFPHEDVTFAAFRPILVRDITVDT